jgi:hypothetical protein
MGAAEERDASGAKYRSALGHLFFKMGWVGERGAAGCWMF